jgi:hypothetical protein
MARKKTRAIIQVSDGLGGLRHLSDRRFEQGPWLYDRELAPPGADTWLQYLSAECARRGLQCSGVSQIDAKENGGSFTIRPAGSDPQPELVVVWERKRRGSLVVRARAGGMPNFGAALATSLLETVSALAHTGARERFFCAGYVEYDGLPWRGEHWLGNDLRLGPPPREDEIASYGPRAILVEANVEGIDLMDARASFRVQLRELGAFLGVALRKGFRVPSIVSSRAWVWDIDANSQVQGEVRYLGYATPPPREHLPVRGLERAVLEVQLSRPNLNTWGFQANETEQSVPADLDELWQRFSQLPRDGRDQFLRVATLWQLSSAVGREFETAALANLVAACEALKPPEADQRLNAYDVVEALLGKQQAAQLRSVSQPQKIRHAQFHAGELRGREFEKLDMMASYRDPTFMLSFNEMWVGLTRFSGHLNRFD